MNGPSARGDGDTNRPGSVAASWIFGGILLAFLGAIVFVLPEPSPFQLALIRFLVALDAAFLSYFFFGNVVLRGNLLGLSIGSGGGFAIFILLIAVVNPFALKTEVADVAPQIIPPDAHIAQAQGALRALGLYSGPVTGVADSSTRTAIASFQSRQHLPPDGYLGPVTRERLLQYPGPRNDAGSVQSNEGGESAHSSAPKGQNQETPAGNASTPQEAPAEEPAQAPTEAQPTAEANAQPADDDVDLAANCQLNTGTTGVGKEFEALRQRTSSPTPSDIDSSVDIAALMTHGGDSSQWSETKGAAIQAYVAGIRLARVDPQYCLTRNSADLDIEIDLAVRPGDTTYVIGDITPQMRKAAATNGKDWSMATLRSEFLGKTVQLSGWLLFNRERAQDATDANANGAQTKPASAWEIEPVTSIALPPSPPGIPSAPILSVQ